MPLWTGAGGEIKLKREWKNTHGPQLETAHIFEANDVLVAYFFSFFFLLS
jgi:hypothetical protein